MTQRIELKIGNVLDKLKMIESDSVDCICTSPPYYGLRKYKAPEVWWDTNKQIGHSATEPNNYCECGAWLGQLGLEPDYRMYLNHMLKVTAELKRVLKPTGTLWLNMGDTYNGNKKGKTDNIVSDHAKEGQAGLVKSASPFMQEKSLMQLPARLSIRMADEQGWILRNTLIWHKRNHMPGSVKDRLTNSYEYVFFFTKQKRYFFNLDAVRVPVKFPEDVARRMHQDKQANVNPFNKGTDAVRHTKQDLAHNRTGTYNDPLHTKPLNPLGKNPGDVLELSTMPFKGSHFAVFPPKLPEFCIKAGSPENGVVLDPFAGSGTTMMVARQLGRSAIGIEISPEYAELIKKRLIWGFDPNIEWKVD